MLGAWALGAWALGAWALGAWALGAPNGMGCTRRAYGGPLGRFMGRHGEAFRGAILRQGVIGESIGAMA